MYLISEFSKLNAISFRMLRYYDQNDLFKPAKVDVLTGYRYYSAKQIPVLNRIKALRDFGFQVQEIKDCQAMNETEFISEQKISLPDEYLSFTVFHDQGYRDTDVDLEIAVVIPLSIVTERSYAYYTLAGYPLAASIMVIGSYKNIDPTYQAFANWLEQHPQYKMIGNTRQISHRDPWNTELGEEYLTEIIIPIEIRK